jgi:EAL domain-containing protein (putative c-di-GMP-specific phosphodiesterase class I)
VALVRAIVAMAHSLALRVVAEGVETPAQLEFLQELGCDCLQGFLMSHPLDALRFTGFLGRIDREPAAGASEPVSPVDG